MKAIAQENLGMIRAPSITSFEFPSKAYLHALVIGAFSFVRFFPEAGIAQPVLKVLGLVHIKRALQLVAFFHVLESLYTLVLCKRHKTGLVVGVGRSFSCLSESLLTVLQALYVISTLACGYPIWSDLRRRIQKARIDSVMKVQ